MRFIFWLSMAIVFYTYIGYPLLLVLLSKIKRKETEHELIMPHVSIIIAAYNEQRSIEQKLQTCLALDYDKEKLEIIVASDGSTDNTVQIAQQYAEKGVKVFDYQPNRGKISILNDTVPQARGEIVVFSDASCMLEPDSIKNLVAHFADPGIGCVSGVYKVMNKEEAALGKSEDIYWKYETFIKVKEAEIGALLGAHGSLYAIRKKLYPPLKPGTINDDYIIPVRIIQQGYRMGYEPNAVAYEEAQEMGGFSRRIRIMAGNYQQMLEIKGFFRPVQFVPLFGFLSHKFGRVVVPFFMVMLLISNVFLLEFPAYRSVWYIQLAFYGTAVLGVMIRQMNIKLKILQLPFYFCMINLAGFLGFYYAYFSRSNVVWRRR